MPRKILVTGSNGFVGKSLCPILRDRGFAVLGSVRSKCTAPAEEGYVVIKGLEPNTKWKSALEGCDVVVHLAGRAHKLNEKHDDSLALYRSINTLSTLNLAQQAAECGVTRFIFLSSVGVNGSMTSGNAFRDYDSPAPHSPYAVSKLEAENGLLKIASRTKMDVVIIRSPLIYGLDAPGNIGMLEKCIKLGVPLPFGSISNKRSLVAIENLISFIIVCIEHERAANQLFLISDNDDLSTLEVAKVIGKLMGKEPYMIKVSVRILWFILKLLGREKMGVSLMSDLQLDIGRSLKLLDWTPPFSPKELIESTG